MLEHLYHVLIGCMVFSFEKFGRLFDDTLNGRPGQEKNLLHTILKGVQFNSKLGTQS
jgi:hypothetical protein